MPINRLIVIIVLLFLFLGWSYLLYLNPNKTETTLPGIGTFSVPTIVYITIPIILFGLVIIFFFMGLKDKIKEFLNARKDKQQERITSLFEEGVRLMNGDKPKDAIPLFKKIVATGKDHGEVKLQLGRAFRKMGNFEEALKWDILARQSEGNQINVLKSLEKDYIALNRIDDATHTLRIMGDLDPENVYILERIRDVNINHGNWSEAFEYQKLIIKHTRDKDLLKKETELILGIGYELALKKFNDNDYNESLKLVKEIQKIDPNFLPANVLAGDIYVKTNNTQNAIKHWIKCFSTTPASIFLTKINELLIKDDKPEELLKIYKDQFKDVHNKPLVKFHQAILKIRLGMNEEAYNELDEIFAMNLDFPTFHYYLAELYSQMGDYEKSINEYKEYIKGLDRGGIIFLCRKCQARMNRWSGSCPKCKAWNTLSFVELEKLTPEDLKEILPPKRLYDYSSRLIIDESEL